MASGTDNAAGGSTVRRARVRAMGALALFASGTLIGAELVARGWAPLAVWVLGGSGLVLCLGVLGSGVPARAGRFGDWVRVWALAVCVLGMGCGWTMLRVDPHRPGRVSAVVGEVDARLGRVPIEVRGVVSRRSRVERRTPGLADPPMWPQRTNRAEVSVISVLVHEGAGRARWVDAGGTLRVVLPVGVVLDAGERVELLGNYGPPPGRRNPGEPDWSLYSAQTGRVGSLVVDDPGHVRVLHPGGLGERVAGAYRALRGTLRERALASVGLEGVSEPEGDGGTDPGGAMRAALLLGHREGGFEEVFGRFQRVGVAHVLAISGFHLALVVLMLALGVRALGEHPRLEALVVVVALVGVVVLIPLRPPIVRAAVIVGAMLLATGAGRRYDRLTVLAWVGLGLLVWRPLDAASMGWQLSMGVTGLLVVLGGRRQRMLLDRQTAILARPNRRGLVGRGGSWLWGLFKVNLACWAVALPTVMYHAGVVGVLAPLVAVVLVPMVAAVMALGYAQVLIGIVWPALAQRTLGVVDWASGWMLGLVEWVDGLGFAWVRVPAVSAWWALAATLVIVLVVTRAVSWKRVGVAAAGVVVLAWGFAQPVLARPDAPVRVVMLDVGDGSGVVVQSGGEALVWDCGSLDRRVGPMAARALRAMGVRRVSGAVVTHDNLDHYNALPDLARHAGLGRVWITERLDTAGSAAWRRVRADLEARGVEIELIEAGDVLTLGEARLSVLWPDPDAIAGFDDNDTSVVALVHSVGSSETAGVLLTGDIEGPAMAMIAGRVPDLPARLGGGALELPHHGSARDEAYGFIGWLDPGVVLQSTGPSRLGDARWAGLWAGRDWYTSARGGASWVRIERDGSIGHGWWFGE